MNEGGGVANQSIAGVSVAGLFGGRAQDGDRAVRARLVLVLLAVLFAAAMLFSLTSGASDASAFAVLRDWIFGATLDDAAAARARVIIQDIRLPRMLMGVLVGAALAVSGAVMQGLFRNPLADPALVGVSSGGALAAATTIVIGDRMTGHTTPLPFAVLPIAAFGGSLITTAILQRLASRGRTTSIAIFLLAGLAIAALAGAGIGAEPAVA